MSANCAFEIMANQKFEHLENQLDSVQTRLSKIDDTLNRLYTHIAGDQEFGHQGLIKRVEYLEKSNQKLMEYKNKIIGGSVVAGATFTLIFEFIKTYVLK